jgi:integrase
VDGEIVNEISVKELAVKTCEALREGGVTEYNIWKQYSESLLPVARWYKRNGYGLFSVEITNEYLSYIAERRSRGEIGAYYYRLRKGAERMIEIFEKGSLKWEMHSRGSKYVLNDYYSKLLAEFSGSENFHKNTLGDIVWVTRKFFAWLMSNEHNDLTKVGADEIQRFIIDCSNSMKINGVHNVKLYLKKLCMFLYKRELLQNSYEELLKFRVSRESRLLPTTTPKEIDAVLNIIDCNTPKGKRDYAMIMLAVVTGLRAVDIMRLKLADIDWYKGEINIVQSKTGQALQLPLTADIGEALKDYILHGRQKTSSQEIFLRHKAPYQGFADEVAIGDIYDEYRKAAGYTRIAFDGKGFHSLRRTAGTNLVTSDISLAAAAQILGKVTTQSMKKYVSLDTVHLKECALGFADIDSEAAL